MVPIAIKLTPGDLTSPCYNSEQARFNDYVKNIQSSLPINFTTVIVSTSAPGPDDRDKIWLQVDGNNRIVGLNTFANGQWETMFPSPPYIVPGEYRAYDPSKYTPLAPWFPCDGSVTTVPDLRGRFLVTAGQRTLPAGSTDTNTNFINGATGGTETEVLIANNIPAHPHDITGGLFGATAGGPGIYGSQSPGAAGVSSFSGVITGGNSTGTGTGGTPNPPAAFTTLPPYYVVAYMQWRPDLV